MYFCVFWLKTSRTTSDILLIASPNVTSFYTELDPKWREDIKFEKYMKFEVFKAMMENMSAGKVIISVVENFLVDAFQVTALTKKEEIKKEIDEVIKVYLGVVQEAADRLPQTKFDWWNQ